MPRKGPTAAIVLPFPVQSNPEGPQPPEPAMINRSARRRQFGILEQNQDELFRRFRNGTLPRSLAAKFGVTERDACAIINDRFDQRLAMRRAA